MPRWHRWRILYAQSRCGESDFRTSGGMYLLFRKLRSSHCRFSSKLRLLWKSRVMQVGFAESWICVIGMSSAVSWYPGELCTPILVMSVVSAESLSNAVLCTFLVSSKKAIGWLRKTGSFFQGSFTCWLEIHEDRINCSRRRNSARTHRKNPQNFREIDILPALVIDFICSTILGQHHFPGSILLRLAGGCSLVPFLVWCCEDLVPVPIVSSPSHH